ncbi:MAG: ACT domain-containing protein [Lentisphaeria bacterium]
MAHQVSVFVENKPGRLEKVTGTLGQAGINIRAMTLNSSSGGWGVLNLLVNRPAAAKDALTAAGFLTALHEIVVVEMADRPGGLHEVVSLLAKAGLNVENAYGTVLQNGRGAILVINVEKVARARDILAAAGIHPLEDDAIYAI